MKVLRYSGGSTVRSFTDEEMALHFNVIAPGITVDARIDRNVIVSNKVAKAVSEKDPEWTILRGAGDTEEEVLEEQRRLEELRALQEASEPSQPADDSPPGDAVSTSETPAAKPASATRPRNTTRTQ